QVLALFFYSGIAAGVVLISAAKALNANLFAFLFGSILTVTRGDLVLVGTLGAAGLAVVAVLYRGFVAAAIDEEGARVSGVPVGRSRPDGAAGEALMAALAMLAVAAAVAAPAPLRAAIAADRAALHAEAPARAASLRDALAELRVVYRTLPQPSPAELVEDVE